MAFKGEGITIAEAEETITWTLDFISIDLSKLDLTEKLKLSMDAQKYLKLWDVSAPKEGISIQVPRLELEVLQQKLQYAFDIFFKPLLTGENDGPIKIPFSESWSPRVFVKLEGILLCTRLITGELEKIGVANFVDAIHSMTPLPVERFRNCDGCNRWFFPTGKRVRQKRRFCSRTCNLRETSRQQRERIKQKRQTEQNKQKKKGKRVIRFKGDRKRREGKKDGDTE
ncbi:hypothetical protein ACFL4N_04195 [Thermodesulfobacteriota bacterium]